MKNMMVFGRKSYVEIVLVLAVILVATPILFSQLPASVSAACTNWAGLSDNDCDGLADEWEQNGYNINGDAIVDLTFPGANKDRKDIYVELDYMKDGTKDHTPRTGVVQAVIDAFNAAPVSNPGGQPDGINLHILVNEPIPHVDSITMWSGFDALKDTWFGENSVERSKPFTMQAKDNTYHYVLFIHKYNGGTSSGLAELPGDDLVVSLGASIWGSVGGHNVGSLDQQKGTLIHELGHNLNLRHGGNVDENCKSNYLSVMNYMFQFSNYVSDRRLDYSRSQLNTLNESALSEPMGISPASSPPGQKSIWGLNGLPWITPPLSQSINPIDWNKNGAISGSQSLNINNLGANSGCPSTLKTPLGGFADWGNLMFWGVTGGHGNGTIVSNGAGAGNGTIDNATVMSSSVDLANEVNVVDATAVGSTIDVAALANQSIGINSTLPVNSTNQGVGLNMTNATDNREGSREGLDEYNAENLVSSRVYLLESIIIEVDSLPDEDFANKTSKVTLLNSLRTIGDGFNSNSTDLAPSISGLTEIRNLTNSSVINPNTQNFLASQIDNFVEGLKKQQ